MENIIVMQNVWLHIRNILVFFIGWAFEKMCKVRILKNLFNILANFDMQPGEIVMGLILSVSIFGYGKVEPYAPGGNAWVFIITAIGMHNIYAACDLENNNYLYNRIKSQFVLLAIAIYMNIMIRGLNLDGINHAGEGANVFWYFPPFSSLLFILRNYLDLKINRKER